MKIAGGILIGLAVLLFPEFILPFVNGTNGQWGVAEFVRSAIGVLAIFVVGVLLWRWKPHSKKSRAP